MITASIISNNIDSVNANVEFFAKSMTPIIFGERQRNVTLELSNSSLDHRGRTMKPLSKSYRKFKMSLGLPGKPNMRLYGDMLDPRNFSFNDKTDTLGFAQSQEEKVKGNQAQRSFFGVHPTALRMAELDTIRHFNSIK